MKDILIMGSTSDEHHAKKITDKLVLVADSIIDLNGNEGTTLNLLCLILYCFVLLGTMVGTADIFVYILLFIFFIF